MKRITEAEQLRAGQIIDLLDTAMPDAKIELNYSTPLELLVAVVLSAQCTDKRVNLATPALFARYPTAQDYASTTTDALEPYIKSLGLFRNKAKNLIAACTQMVAQGGQVPASRDDLAKLPGVGPKTAGVVAMHLGTGQAFPVDTHVGRLARRMDLTRQDDPNKVEQDLSKLLPAARWEKAHQLLVWHGRRVCHARSPECGKCVVAHLCPRRDVDIPDPVGDDTKPPKASKPAAAARTAQVARKPRKAKGGAPGPGGRPR
jgi:endonuclease-3